MSETQYATHPQLESKTAKDNVSWHGISGRDAVEKLQSDAKAGLSEAEVETRRGAVGLNRLTSPPGKPWWKEMIEELAEPMILLLLLVGVVYGFLGEIRDAETIVIIIIAVLAIEMFNEGKAKGAIQALSRLTAIRTPVVRNGEYREIDPSELVPGDLVIFRAGERIPADLRLLESVSLKIDESGLTGESMPVSKDASAILCEETDLGDRRNLAFSGTLVRAGKGTGIVIRTGMATELGKIVGMVKKAREPRTPLQMHMKELSRWMVWIALFFSIFIAFIGWMHGTGWKETLLNGLTLAFATIPEELPILITMVLGVGAYRLSKQNAIIRRLRTAELVGNVSVIATDKTGTLTENRMHVDKWVVNGQEYGRANWNRSHWTDMAVRIGCMANDGLVSVKGNGKASFDGDPTDTAFLQAAVDFGYDVAALRDQYRLMGQFPLEDATGRLSVSVLYEDRPYLMIKGAPEHVLGICEAVVHHDRIAVLTPDNRDVLLRQAGKLAGEGYRIIALAYKDDKLDFDDDRDRMESRLVFVGFAALFDPPRSDAAEAIDTLRQAGIRVLMVTGDHAGTACSIASRVGLDASRVLEGRTIESMSDDELRERLKHTSVCARTTPEHKLRIVRALQSQGEFVAVTGDGVNDGPALKEAAVGIAMGRSGTDAAKESADMVLADDRFGTVAVAVREGRTLFANLRKAVRYYLAAKVALISSTLFAAAAGLPLPFAPIQIIVMELFMDLGAASSFTAEPGEADVMKRPPRSLKRRFMDRSMAFGIFSGGCSLGLAVSAAYMLDLSAGNHSGHAQSAAFAVWMIGHLVLALIMRSEREPVVHLGLLSNRVMLLWAASAICFLLLAVYVPSLKNLLHLDTLHVNDWVLVVVCSFLAPSWMEIGKWIRWRRRAH